MAQGELQVRFQRHSQYQGLHCVGVAFANKETIISGGAYNTPQLLKLSGIGPATELRKFNIPVVIDLPGVGENLQDRYENSVIVNTPEPWTVFKGCTAGVNASDPCLIEWQTLQSNKSRYATNGRPVLIPLRSSGALNANNDLVVTGRPGYFG
jgi:choline dehydrogenase